MCMCFILKSCILFQTKLHSPQFKLTFEDFLVIHLSQSSNMCTHFNSRCLITSMGKLVLLFLKNKRWITHHIKKLCNKALPYSL